MSSKRLLMLILLSALFFGCTPQVHAQSTPKLDLFAGYSFLHSPESDVPFPSSLGVNGTTFFTVGGNLNPVNGFNLSITRNFNRWLGFTGEVGGNYNGNGIKNHTFMIGPKFSLRQSRVAPFVHTLFGLNRQSPTDESIFSSFPGTSPPVTTFSGSNTGFAWVIGGGVDYRTKSRISMRLFQADYLRDNHLKFNTIVGSCVNGVCPQDSGPSPTSKANNLRLSFGVVFHL